MFEATLERGAFWKKVVEAMKDLVTEANFECTPQGISIQSVDSSHVALVSLSLGSKGFEHYDCLRQTTLGVNLNNLAKLLKVTDDKDSVTLRHQEDTDVLTIASEASAGKRSTEFQLKLMEIEQDAVGIPDEEQSYPCTISLPADVFAKTCRDMNTFGDTMTVEISRDKVKFTATGDLGDGNITIMSNGMAEKAPIARANVALKNEPGVVKNENGTQPTVKKDVVKEEPKDDDNIAESFSRTETNGETKKTKNSDKNSAMQSDGVYISCAETMSLTFALRYLAIFAKGVALADRVTLSLAGDQPCRVEYVIPEIGSLRWFLAPKVDDEAEEQQ